MPNPFSDLTSADFATRFAPGNLIPRGAVWGGPNQTAIFAAVADTVAWLHGRATVLLEVEADPAQTMEMLADWETAFGLPDPCTPLNATLQQRHDALLARIAAQGGQSRAYFIAVAAALGFTITIEERQCFRAGQSAAGDAVWPEAETFTWIVHAPAQTIIYFRAGLSAAGDALQTVGNTSLECVLTRLAPAETNLLFAYGD